MNALLHIATFVASLWFSRQFYDNGLDELGWVVIILVFWLGILTLLAVWEDVGALFHK